MALIVTDAQGRDFYLSAITLIKPMILCIGPVGLLDQVPGRGHLTSFQLKNAPGIPLRLRLTKNAPNEI